jgi:hypothetical protein
MSTTSDDQNYIDDVQNHMLSLVVSIMENYGLTPDHITERYGYKYLESEDIVEELLEDPKKNLIYVRHRREFRDALTNGLKICSEYMNCTNGECTRFHVKKENLCPHAGRNNYCDQNDCEKIVIKACRRGIKCNDSSCSFRH